MTKTAIIGIGNILLRDEGTGVHTVNVLKQMYSFSPEVDIIDGGTLGLDLLPLIEDREGVLLIDAVNFGKEPGFIGILEGDEIPSILNAKLSVHHIGLSDVLFAARLLGSMPSKICLIGIQPEFIETGLKMTDCIEGRIGQLIDLTIKKLKEWNIECALLSPQGSSAEVTLQLP